MSWQGEKIPRMVGEYRIERRIGAGGMGVVFLAVSPSGRQVALKAIRGEFAEDADYRARFRQEIEAARQVSGAFTASVVGADPDADPPWMATQYLDAPTLSDRVRKDGVLDEKTVWQLGRGLAEALRDIHRVGLVHRDLKPSNVLLTEDGPRVIDFGIARVLNAEPVTRTGKILGSVSFMAPEQVSTPREVGVAADVFALGGVLTFAATGRGPFDGDAGTPPIAVAMKIVHDNPDLTDLPSILRSIIEKCLSKNPANRPSPAELLDLLRQEGEFEENKKRILRKENSSRLPRPARFYLSVTAAVIAASAAAIAVTHMGGIGKDGKTGTSTTQASPTATNLGVEKVAALRPKGWAVWEKPATALARETSEPPSCGGIAGALVCAEAGGVIERIDVASGRTMWSKKYDAENSPTGSVAGFTGKMVVVSDINGENLTGLDMETGERTWSVRTAGTSSRVMQKSTVAAFRPNVNGSIIDLRDLRTGRVVKSRSLASGEWHQIVDGGEGVLYLLTYAEDEGFIKSLAALDSATLQTTKVLATFDKDPGSLVAADGNSVSFLLAGRSLTRVTKSDGTVTLLPLKEAPEGATQAQDNTLYISRADGTLASYDLQTGRHGWTAETGGESPARPVVADGRLYSLASDGRIVCLDAETGKIIWRSAARRNASRPIYGTPGSHPEPVVLNGVVYIGATTGSIFAVAPPE
ncbi:serine/threonine protein kinase [Streptomyces nitrosporeus]|nr:serine/threonine-protein kinase [Streptomyces nitrosporeus]GGZ18535.1 serine/threonine protein kinase [Streptomyces nitrosporeus]